MTINYILLLTLITSVLILAGGFGLFVPRIVAHYGRTYFGDERMVGAHTRIFLFAITTIALAFAVPHCAPLQLPGIALMLVAAGGVVIADQRYQIIPDGVQATGAAGALIFLLWATELTGEGKLLRAAVGTGAALSFFCLAKLYTLVRKREALGLGDIKLLAWLGLAFGAGTIDVLLTSLIAGMVFVIPRVFTGRLGRHAHFAFGPYLIFGAAAVALWSAVGGPPLL